MFVNALKTANKYTHPVVISKRYESGTVESGCAAYILLNKDGWALTAAHVVNDLTIYENDKKKKIEREKEIEKIQEDKSLNDKQKKRKISQIPKHHNAITNISYWWASDITRYENIIYDRMADLAIVKLVNAIRLNENEYPTFYKSEEENLPVGRSLCRVGFPFHEIKSTFDPSTNRFILEEGTLPIPRFANDGILTRGAKLTDISGRKALFIETSTPGLRGQSGGPIFDTDGRIWGIQSSTRHLALGFSPKIQINNKEITEHQFINIGVGVHTNTVIEFLEKNNVQVNISDKE